MVRGCASLRALSREYGRVASACADAVSGMAANISRLARGAWGVFLKWEDGSALRLAGGSGMDRARPCVLRRREAPSNELGAASSARSAAVVVVVHQRLQAYRSPMELTVESITKAMLSLPSDVRALLADRLVESLDPLTDESIRDAWASESLRRLDDVRSGRTRTVSRDEALARVRAKLK